MVNQRISKLLYVTLQNYGMRQIQEQTSMSLKNPANNLQLGTTLAHLTQTNINIQMPHICHFSLDHCLSIKLKPTTMETTFNTPIYPQQTIIHLQLKKETSENQNLLLCFSPENSKLTSLS